LKQNNWTKLDVIVHC